MLMRMLYVGVFLWFCVSICFASVFGTVRGIVHDPQHRPIEGASIHLKALASDWTRDTVTDQNGEFQWTAIPVGQYQITVSLASFSPLAQKIEVQSGSAPILHFPLKVAAVNQTVEVSAAPEWINPDSAATQSIVSRDEISRIPGADRSNSLAMITNFTPGAYIVHDQLHIRGGHQVSWLVDGVPVPNTSIAANVGPQFDPQDIDYLEVTRGGYAAEYGDRTYGVFNIVPRTGFERNNEAELALSYGSFNETNDHFSLGSHTQRFAYYVGLTGNRTGLGLQPPVAEALHGQSSSLSGFTSLIYNPDPANQLRFVGSARADHYQVPNSPEMQAQGIRDVQREHDAFLIFSWVRNLGSGVLLTVSPFFHQNHAAFEGGPGDNPVIATNALTSNYMGAESALSIVSKRHNVRLGFSVWGQQERSLLGLQPGGESGPSLRQAERVWGNLETAYAEDQYRMTSWLTLTGGLRLARFSGRIGENAASPRAGAALRLPGLNWVLRGFYGRYYQPPPLSTISGPILDHALQQGFDFLPLHGERDEQWEVGLAIPVKGWALDLSYFHTNAHNFFDHTPLGDSNLFIPVTLDAARLRGWEATMRSPRILRRIDLHMAYSHQYAQAAGEITGGLTDFSPPESGLYFLDHDQRNTFTGGFESDLPWKTWITGNIAVGSGFLDGDGPGHLPMHTTIDLSLGRSFGERVSVRFSALNLTNHRYLLDNSNTFGGTHFNYPRQILVSLRYRFHY